MCSILDVTRLPSREDSLNLWKLLCLVFVNVLESSFIDHSCFQMLLSSLYQQDPTFVPPLTKPRRCVLSEDYDYNALSIWLSSM